MSRRPARVAALAVTVAALAGNVPAQSVAGTPPLIDTLGTTILYAGPVDRAGADALIPLIESGRFHTLRIESAGGNVEAGMAIGHAVHEHRLDIEVRRYCASSCANYIFTAGHAKTLRDGALIVWHGDARQWNFVEERRRLEAKATIEGTESLTALERDRLAYAVRVQAMQDRFYARIGVRDGFARIGHELRPRTLAWTIPVARMAQFGITNVEAPPDYGTAQYCRRAVDRNAKVACLVEADAPE